MRRRWRWMFLLGLCAATLAGGCARSSGPQPQQGQPPYQETKSMVLDILHSKEGMDTLRQTVQSQEFKRSLILSDSDMQKALTTALTQGENKNLLQQQLQQPQFAKALADALKEQHRQLLKDLMKDPEYQQMMLDLMKSPDFQKQILSLMSSPPYRQQTMKVMQEALQNPSFRLLFTDSLKQAVREVGPQAGQGKQGGQGGQQQGGGQSSGGGGDQDQQSQDMGGG
ncbi:spore germination lipoprotein GerD [Kyrpidia spormannii]|nr:spore germination lipoprotein GerD [Kyrpidia spormannii]